MTGSEIFISAEAKRAAGGPAPVMQHDPLVLCDLREYH